MQQSISYAKLNDESWGVRYAARGRHPSPGDEVQVRKADGSINTVTLGAVVMHDHGAFPGPATYFRIARRNGNGNRPRNTSRPARRPTVRPLPKEALIEAGRRLADDLATAKELHAAYSEDGYDGETEIRDAAIARIRRMEQELATLRRQYREHYAAR